MSVGTRVPFHSEAQKNLRHNYAMNCLDGGFFAGGIAFVSLEAILPTIVKDLGGPNWLISLMPQILFVGFMLPPLLTAHWIERMQRVMPMMIVVGILQRTPYLLATLALFFLADSVTWLALAMVASAPFLTGLAGGFSMPAWTQLVARIIPPHRRASSAAIRAVLGAAIGLGAGEIAKHVLEAKPGPDGYGLLHLFAFISLAISLLFFSLIREPNDRAEIRMPRRTFRQNIRSLPEVMRNDVNFRKFVLNRLFAIAYFIVTPFLAIHALEVTGESKPFLGALVQAQMVGLFLGNFAAGYMGDKVGGKSALLMSRTAFLLLVPLAVFYETPEAFIAVFFLYGFSHACEMVGQQTLGLEVCPPDRIPTYQALMGTLSVPAMLAAAGMATLMREMFTAFWPAAVAAACGVLISLFFLLRVKDPRNA